MINKFVNERVVMIITSVGLFYYLYTKYLELSERQDYLERNVVGVVEHLNKLTIDQVVRDVGETASNTDAAEDNEQPDHLTVLREQSDAVDSDADMQSETLGDGDEENYDDPLEEPEDETIIIGGSRSSNVKGSLCNSVLHSGARKGFVCGKPAKDGFCWRHKNKVPKPMASSALDQLGEPAEHVDNVSI